MINPKTLLGWFLLFNKHFLLFGILFLCWHPVSIWGGGGVGFAFSLIAATKSCFSLDHCTAVHCLVCHDLSLCLFKPHFFWKQLSLSHTKIRKRCARSLSSSLVFLVWSLSSTWSFSGVRVSQVWSLSTYYSEVWSLRSQRETISSNCPGTRRPWDPGAHSLQNFIIIIIMGR